MKVVADTGAQVCVAGPELLRILKLKPSQLQHRTGLRDVANRIPTPLGSFTCNIELNKKTVTQDIYFIKSAKGCYISLSVCKKLGIVHQNFPLPMTTVASVELTTTAPVNTPGKTPQPLHSGPPEVTYQHSGPLEVTPSNSLAKTHQDAICSIRREHREIRNMVATTFLQYNIQY